MRRLLLVVSMVVLAGCNRDMFKPGAGTAAVAGSAKLSPERLADFVGRGEGCAAQQRDRRLHHERVGGLFAVRPGRRQG